MKTIKLVVCVFLILFSTESRAADVPLSGLSEGFKMDGVSGYIEGKARELFKQAISKEGVDWMVDAFANAINSARDRKKNGSSGPPQHDEALKAAVQAELKSRIKKWLPGAMKDLITKEILGGELAPEAVKEATKIAERVVKEMDTSLNERIDQVVGGLYNETVTRLKNLTKNQIATAWIDPTNIRGSIARAMSMGQMGEWAAVGFGQVVGEASVTAIRSRISDALNGQLPPEAIAALQKGPEAFEEYVKKAEKYFPSNQLSELTNSVLNRPLIKLPTPVYATILGATAAGHFARAFKGVYVDAYELKRGVEVTRVMVWQLQNKEWINLSIMQLGNLTKALATQIGLGANFDDIVSKIKGPLDEIQKKADEIDKLLKKPIEEVRDTLKKATDEITEKLKLVQDKIMKPVKDAIDKAQSELDKGRKFITDQLPEDFNGIPTDWEELKKKAGLENGVFGELGNLKPMDYVRDDLDKLNDVVSDKLAKAGTETIDAFGLMGPAAKILDVEKVPAKNGSESKELDPVLLHNGEFVSQVTDIVIPGRGLDFRFTRTYRGRGEFLGELGNKWTHSYAERLLPWNDGLTYVDEEGRKFFFRIENGKFISPKGLDLMLVVTESGGYELFSHDKLITSFDVSGRPTKKIDRYGNQVTYIYDGNGLLSEIMDPYLRRIKITRRVDGLITGLEDFAGRTIEYKYNDERELIGVTSPKTPDFPNGKTTAYRYTKNQMPAHAIKMIMDPKGQVYLRNEYDVQGRVVAQSYGNGPWMHVLYGEGSGDISSRAWVTDTKGVTRLYENDADGHLLRLWRLRGSEYQLIVSEPPYDSEKKINVTYNNFGQALNEVNENGVVAHYKYYFSDDPDGDGVKIKNINDKTSGGYLKSIEKEKAVTTFTYDTVGNITSVTNPDGAVTQFVVDALNHIVSEERPSISPIKYYFDENDNLTEAVFDLGTRKIRWFFRYDILDRLISEKKQVSEGNGSVNLVSETKYEWDSEGRLKSLTDPNGDTARFEYDLLGRLILERFADGTERRTLYDSKGLITRIADRNGSILNVEYDENDRIVKRYAQMPNGILGNVLQTFKYDELGRLTEAVDVNDFWEPSVVSFVYDSLSRSVAEAQNDRWITRQFDESGKVVMRTYPSGEKLFYSYNSDDQLSSIIRGDGQLASFEYDFSGNIARGNLGTNKYFSISRDALGRIRSKSYERKVDVVLYDTDITYNKGLITQERVGDYGRTYSYDFLNRLIEGTDIVVHSDEDVDPVIRRWEYNYEPNENIKYDSGGNITSDGEREFRYDAFGRLIGVWRGNKPLSQFTYDAFNRRVSKIVGGAEEDSIWDGWRLIENINGSENRDYVYGNDFAPIGAIVKGRTTFFLTDIRGSVIAKISDEKDVYCSYSPYGEPLQTDMCDADEFPFGFASHIYDKETSLLYMRNRYFDPKIGRFMTPDPLMFKMNTNISDSKIMVPALSYHTGLGGASLATLPNKAYPFGRLRSVSNGLFNSDESDLYMYARNNPVMFWDPFGLASLLFDRSDFKMRLISKSDDVIAEYAASNRAVSTHRPSPNGTYEIGIPEFYSEEYRKTMYEKYNFGPVLVGESVVTGPSWAGEKRKNYNVSQGFIRFRMGSGFNGGDVPWNRELFVHAGRDGNFKFSTQGCIRMKDSEIEQLAFDVLELNRLYDPVTTITVRD